VLDLLRNAVLSVFQELIMDYTNATEYKHGTSPNFIDLYI